MTALNHADERLWWIALSQISGVGDRTYCKLLQAFGSPEHVFAAPYHALCEVVSKEIADDIHKGPDEVAINPTLQWLNQPNNHLITLADSHYPASLLEIADPPALLFAKGQLSALKKTSIAVVGSRNASVQGEKNAQAFSHDLARQGLCIVSGLALGIDGAAHRGALEAQGTTIAVVGTGLDIVYPARHRELAHQIVQQGLILSEFPLGTPSRAQNFPKRNRIISGLTRGCLVIEANLESGSLITARLATEQGRDVFAIPGSIHSPLSKGCHHLIKQGAKLVDCIEDILAEIQSSVPNTAFINEENTTQPNTAESHSFNENNADTTTDSKTSLSASPRLSLSPEQQLLETMGYDPISLESLLQLSPLTAEQLSAMLLILEIDHQVTRLPGGRYQRLV